VHVLVANVGIQVFAPLLEMNGAQWHDVIDVNLTGMANTVRAFAPLLVKQGAGRIIITASGQGKRASGTTPATPPPSGACWGL
jgi:NAD(P)-dependent dehydrogenase (short-subunit alcohol dehydrogenase family)